MLTVIGCQREISLRPSGVEFAVIAGRTFLKFCGLEKVEKVLDI